MNNRVYKKGLAVVLIIALLIMTVIGIKLSDKKEEMIFTGFENYDHDNEANKEQETQEVQVDNSKSSDIYVDIDGAVNNPGVYKLKSGDRVIDAINMAGGLSEDSYTKNLNKARSLVDGEKIYILTVDEIKNESEGSNLININTSSINDLMSLPGIGDVFAARIIDYRKEKLFNTIDEIKNIEGIGDKTFEKIKDLITIGN